MTKRVVRDGQVDFRGGMYDNENLTSFGTTYPPNSVAFLKNLRPHEDGTLITRRGSRFLGVPVANNYYYPPYSIGLTTTLYMFMRRQNTTTYDFVSYDTITDTIFSTQSQTIPTSFNSLYFASKYIYGGSTCAILGHRDWNFVYTIKATGGTITQVSPFPTGVLSLESYNQRLWALKSPGYGLSEILWSAPDDITSLGNASAGGGVASLRQYGYFSAIAHQSNALYAFHRDGIVRIRGYSQDDITIESMVSGSPGIGYKIIPTTPIGVCKTPYGIVFPTVSGLYILRQDESIADLSTGLSRNFRDKLFSHQMLSTRLGRIAYVPHSDELWIDLVNGDTIYVYSFKTKSWTSFTVATNPELAVSHFEFTDRGACVFVQNSSRGNVIEPIHLDEFDTSGTYLYDSWENNYVKDLLNPDYTGGTPYTAQLVTRPFTFGDPHSWKVLRFIHVRTDRLSAPVTAQLRSSQFTTSPVSLPTLTYAGDDRVTRYDAPWHEPFQSVQLVLQWNPTQMGRIISIELEAFDYGHFKR